MPSLWLVDVAGLPPPSGKVRKIGRTPLIDLARLQAAIEDGSLGENDVWLATRDCNNNVQDLAWSFQDLLDCIRCLVAADHKGAEWCQDSHGQWRACDAYAIRYDDTNRCRVRYSDINYYLKFSIEEDGSLMLVMISVHL
jgi:hypothetical protein